MTIQELQKTKERMLNLVNMHIEAQTQRLNIYKSYKNQLNEVKNPEELKKIIEDLKVLFEN